MFCLKICELFDKPETSDLLQVFINFMQLKICDYTQTLTIFVLFSSTYYCTQKETKKTTTKNSKCFTRKGEHWKKKHCTIPNPKTTSYHLSVASLPRVSPFRSNANWSSDNAFVSGTGGLRFESRTGQIGHSVANGSPPLLRFFEKSCVARAQWREMGPANSLHVSAY